MSGFVSFKEGFFEAFRGFAKAFSISEVFSPPRAVGLLFFTAVHFKDTVEAAFGDLTQADPMLRRAVAAN
jgi:hypothetical protein